MEISLSASSLGDLLAFGILFSAFCLFVLSDIHFKSKKLEGSISTIFQLRNSGELTADTPSGIVFFDEAEKLTIYRSPYESQLFAANGALLFKQLFVCSNRKRVLLKFDSYELAAGFLNDLEKLHPRIENALYNSDE